MFYRSSIHCSATCSRTTWCSAFKFEENCQTCQLSTNWEISLAPQGTQDPTTTAYATKIGKICLQLSFHNNTVTVVPRFPDVQILNHKMLELHIRTA